MITGLPRHSSVLLDMVVFVIKASAELDNVESLEFPADHDWCIDLYLTGSGETRERVTVSRAKEVEILNSRGTANLVVKVDKTFATVNVEEIPKLTKSSITESRAATPLIAFECRGCEITKWHPTGFFTVTSSDGSRFDEVDLGEGEWCEVDPETNLPVSILDLTSVIETYKGK